jgi:hypothetical protein
MADEPLFRDRENFEAWLRDKPPEWATVLAGRAALRVLPLLARAWPDLRQKQRLTLFTLRANLVSRVAGLS